MIIDLETQAWTSLAQLGTDSADSVKGADGTPLGVPDGSPEAHDRAMACVDVSFVLGFRSEQTGRHLSSESVAAFVTAAPHKRVGFIGIDPMSPDPMGDLERGVSLGLSGVVISPQMQNVHPTHSRAMRLYERCQSLGLPVIATNAGPLTARAVLEYGRPAEFDEVLRSFPGLKLVIGHLGFPWIDETLAILAKHRNAFADIAGVASRPWGLYNALLSAMEFRVMDRLLFASNFPFDAPQAVIERIYTVNSFTHGTQLPSIPRQQLRGMIERDSLAALGVTRPSGASISRGASSDHAAARIESKRHEWAPAAIRSDDESLLSDDL